MLTPALKVATLNQQPRTCIYMYFRPSKFLYWKDSNNLEKIFQPEEMLLEIQPCPLLLNLRVPVRQSTLRAGKQSMYETLPSLDSVWFVVLGFYFVSDRMAACPHMIN
jgi:hypothetical protein